MSQEEIISYYEDCDIDYRLVWGIDLNFSLHYGFYDSQYIKHHEAVLNMNRVLANKAGIKANDKVLDAGCGVGGSCLWLARKRHAKMTGINITRKQLERARKLADNQGLSDMIEYKEASFLDTGFDDNTFDVVWGMEAVCYAEDKKEFLKEAYRVLKPGGKIAVADGFLNDIDPDPKHKQMLNDWLDGWAVPNLWGKNRFEQDLKDVGFKNIDFTDGSKNVVPSSKRMYKASKLSGFGAKILEALRIRNKTQNRNVLAAKYQYPLLLDGAWIYGIWIAEK